MTEQIGVDPMTLVPDRAAQAHFALQGRDRDAVQRSLNRRRRAGEIQQAGPAGFTLVERRNVDGDPGGLWRLVYFLPSGTRRTIEVSAALAGTVAASHRQFAQDNPGHPRAAGLAATLPELEFQQDAIAEGVLLAAETPVESTSATLGVDTTPTAPAPTVALDQTAEAVDTPLPAQAKRRRGAK